MSQSNHDLTEPLDEISLGDAHYREDSEIVPKIVNHEYVQSNNFKGVLREFSLFDDIYLYCTSKSFNLKKLRTRQVPKYRIDLTYIDPKPVKFSNIAWKWLLWGIVAIAASVLVIDADKIIDSPSAQQAILPVSILLGTSGFVSILLFFYKSHSSVVYRGYVGRAPLIVMANKPRNKDYKDFIDVLETNIRKAQRRNGITIKDRLVGEMKDMRRLRDAGVVSENRYKQAQARIFEHESNQA